MRNAICSLVLLTCACSSPTRVEDGRPPNVLLIIADDQGFADLGCAGLADDVETPSLDRLAADGVRFETAYATSPICNASRAGLITGSYQQRFGTFWYGGKGLHDASFTTLAELLRDAGYATGYVGKFHYGSHATHQPGERSFPLDHGYDSFYGFSAGRKHYLVHNAEAEARFQATRKAHRRKGQSLRQGPMWSGVEKVDQEGFSTELFGEHARAFLREHADEPFFLTLGFNAVHNFTHQLPPAYLEEHGLAGYRDWDPAVEEYYAWYQGGRYPNNPEGRAHYLGQLHFLDREVGRVLRELELLGLADDTLVVYIGDNGGSTPIYADNGPLRGSKYTLYEGGLRVPLIVSWPGYTEPGAVRSNVVSGMDLLPTICTAIGIVPPEHIDGIDLSGLFLREDVGVGHETLYWDTSHETAVRSGRWKLKTATNDNHAKHEMVELELGTFLFDLENDPGETTDVSGRNPEIVERLTALYTSWRESL